MRLPLVLILPLLAVAAPAARAAESYDGCKYVIASVPTVLTQQGVYCLQADIAANLADGVAIEVDANNITIDCNDFKLGNLAAGPATTAVGIRALDRLNTTVRGCGLRGFQRAIQLEGGGFTVERNRLDGNLRMGIYVVGGPSVVRNNLVYDTGPGMLFRASAIEVREGVDVIGNTLTDTHGIGDNMVASGIDAGLNGVAVIRDNVIRDVSATGAGALARGIFTAGGEADVHGNYISTPLAPGIRCPNATGIVHDNRFAGTPTPLSSCVDSGGNIAR